MKEMLLSVRQEITQVAVLHDRITRALRDTYTVLIDVLWVDEPKAWAAARELLDDLWPGRGKSVSHHEGKESLFARFGLPEESL